MNILEHKKENNNSILKVVGIGNKEEQQKYPFTREQRRIPKPKSKYKNRKPKKFQKFSKKDEFDKNKPISSEDLHILKNLFINSPDEEKRDKEEKILYSSNFLDSNKIENNSINIKNFNEGKTWKSIIAHEAKNAVVKILSSIIEFDWEQPYRRSDTSQTIGSGFFVNSEGIFVTNAHVVEEAARVWITIPSTGEKRYDAEVLGICFDVDLAVLKAKDAPVTKYLEFGDSNQVQYGQEVLILGYPLGMDSIKLTEGIISGREESFFQTDAPLNPGNSGGPMLNHEGKVIGINVAIAQQAQNVGFAIPVFHLTQLYETLKNRPSSKKIVHKPILGADFSNSTDAMYKYMNCKEIDSCGIYIRKCYEDFPMYNAGVRDGDLLYKFNGFILDNFGYAEVPWSPYARASLDSLMSLCTYDSKPEIEYIRNGEKFKTVLNFEDPKNPGYPILPIVREKYPPYEKIDFEVIAGMVVMDITMNHISLFHEVHPNETVIRVLTPIAASFKKRLKPAVIICNILLGSLLAKCNVFAAGTILEEVNGIKICTLEEFRKAIMKPIKRENGFFITLMSNANELVILPLEETIKEEFELSEMHLFNVSPLVLKSLNQNKKMVQYICKGNKYLKQKILHSIKESCKRFEITKELENEIQEIK